MFACLRPTAVAALCVIVACAHAQPVPPHDCARGPKFYASGKLATAFRVFLGCAIEGAPGSAFNAAMMIRSGESNAEGQPNWFGARVFLEHAAAQDVTHAIYVLGKEYEIGSPAFRRDLNLATELFRGGALRGHVDAQVGLGTQYLLGRGGVLQDDREAAQWCECAANAGHWGAQHLIASMYEHGNGVGRDELVALHWYERAQAAGDEVAPMKVEQVGLRQATTARQLRLEYRRAARADPVGCAAPLLDHQDRYRAVRQHA
jgi:TPR repeat protein